MKKITVAAFSLAALIALSGCSSDSSDSSGTDNGVDIGGDTSAKTKYEGTWKDSNGFKLVINGTTLHININGTEDNVTTTVAAAGNFSIDGQKTVQPNDITVDKVTHNIVTCKIEMTVLTDDLVNGLNTSNFCGGDWSVNTAKDISDCKGPNQTQTPCEEMKSDPKDIFYIKDENKLFSGDSSQGLDTDGYPEALETDYMTKQ